MCCVFLAIGAAVVAEARAAAAEPSLGPNAQAYGSLQEAIDAHPGRVLFVPAGDYSISRRLVISKDGSGLWGPGRIVQTNPDEAILHVEGAADVRLDGLTLLRSEGAQETRAEAVRIDRCRDVTLANLRVVDNLSQAGSVMVSDSTGTNIVHCRIRNYMRIAVDDRTGSSDWGYAFRCIDGTGIVVKDSRATLLEGNQIIETRLLPTREIQAQHQLGTFVKRSARRGALVGQELWDRGCVDNWHQGSGVLVGGGCDQTRLLGNHIENAAQGIDIHSDHVVVANNIVDNAFIGMKAMHGSRNVIITSNQFLRNDLWAIGLMPGAASHHAAGKPREGSLSDANLDGGSVVANNVISDFGYGNAAWIWGKPDQAFDSCFPIRLDAGQKPANPSLADVAVAGNIVYDSNLRAWPDGSGASSAGPRYRYAVFVHPGANGPTNVRFRGNIFHPGRDGVANVALEP
jgi:hypothetical protein